MNLYTDLHAGLSHSELLFNIVCSLTATRNTWDWVFIMRKRFSGSQFYRVVQEIPKEPPRELYGWGKAGGAVFTWLGLGRWRSGRGATLLNNQISWYHSLTIMRTAPRKMVLRYEKLPWWSITFLRLSPTLRITLNMRLGGTQVKPYQYLFVKNFKC